MCSFVANLFLGLVAFNSLPAATVLLIGGVRWATTLFIVAVIISSLVVVAAIGGSSFVDLLLGSIPLVNTPRLADAGAATGIAIVLQFLIVLTAMKASRRARGPRRTSPARNRIWIARLHEAIHGPGT